MVILFRVLLVGELDTSQLKSRGWYDYPDIMLCRYLMNAFEASLNQLSDMTGIEFEPSVANFTGGVNPSPVEP